MASKSISALEFIAPFKNCLIEIKLIISINNLKPSPIPMEVHHHSHHPKKWKEYITEFIMLFAAVTLGFFAENKREEMVESHRAKQYMQSLYEDLKKDTSMLNSLESYDNLQISKIEPLKKWLLAHPLIKISTLNKAAGLPDNTIKNALIDGTRPFPLKHLPAVIKVLKNYGYTE